ncbi:MAG: polysaccharide deacetylase family protein [Solirubrobacteraceae bacterium]
MSPAVIILDVVRHLFAPWHEPFAHRLGVSTRLESADGVAITFDDGPHPEGTPAVLEVLRRYDARATFFVIGEQVERRPELLQRIVDEGHLVALHGYRHRCQLLMRGSEVADDVARGYAAISSALGAAPSLHRPPYGIYSPAGLAAVRARGMQPLLWSRWGKDWRKLTTPTRIAGRILPGVAAGDVILLHDADFYSSKQSYRRTVAALELIMNRLSAREIGTVLPV